MNENQGTQGVNPTTIDGVLKRYLKIQKEEQTLREEKASLQLTLGDYMKKIGKEQWYPDIDGKKLNVRCRESVIVEYDEELLQERLADMYPAILAPDIRKIRRNLNAVAPLLQTAIEQIGSPSADRVNFAIKKGLIPQDKFSGTFHQTKKCNVSVAKFRQQKIN